MTSPITAGELSALRVLFGQLMWLATQVIPSIASTLVVASGIRWSSHGFPQSLKQTNLLGVRWFRLRHSRDPMFTTVFVLLGGLTQLGLIAVKGITNTAFLEQAACKVSVISWHSGQLARVARSPKLQAAADAETDLTNIRLSLWEILRSTAPLKKSQDVAAQVPATLVVDS